MSERLLLIEPRDATIFRDGKPFDAGSNGARSRSFATPSAIMGAVRTRSVSDRNFAEARVAQILGYSQIGPFLAYSAYSAGEPRSWKLAYPAPADVVAYGDQDPLEWVRLKPADDPEPSCNLPAGLQPLTGMREAKAAKSAPLFWHEEPFLRHLAGNTHPQSAASATGISELPRQKRMHVSITAQTQTATEGMLFGTEGLEFRHGCKLSEGQWGDDLAIASWITGIDRPAWPAVSHLGGENRTAFWTDLDPSAIALPGPPPFLTPSAKQIRMVLLTPGVFRDGWKPGWLDNGLIPGTNGLQVELVAAAVPRTLPLSGWDLRAKKQKPTRFLAPVGSVYFLKVLQGNPADLWLKTVSDDEQDCRDGFGLVMGGIW